VSTFAPRALSPTERQCPCRQLGELIAAGMSCTRWREHCFIRSLMVLPLAADRIRRGRREISCGCSWAMTGLRTITMWATSETPQSGLEITSGGSARAYQEFLPRSTISIASGQTSGSAVYLCSAPVGANARFCRCPRGPAPG